MSESVILDKINRGETSSVQFKSNVHNDLQLEQEIYQSTTQYSVY